MPSMNRRRTDRFAFRHSDALAREHSRVATLRPLCITEIRIHALAAYDRAEAVREQKLLRLLEVCGKA